MPPASATPQAFIVDTSSIIEIRRSIVPNETLTVKRRIYHQLLDLVRRGVVYVPERVLDELRGGSTGGRRPKHDPPLEWAEAARPLAVKDEDLLEYLPAVMAAAPGLADPDKPSAEDHADPYVIALALMLEKRFGYTVITVITEDTVAKPFKMALRDACWIFRLTTVSMRTFLASRSIGVENDLG